MTEQTFREWLKAARKERHLSQLDLAVQLGTTQGTVCDYENGKRTPHPLIEMGIRAFFQAPGGADGETVYVLMGGSDHQADGIPVPNGLIVTTEGDAMDFKRAGQGFERDWRKCRIVRDPKQVKIELSKYGVQGGR